jgi:hypothetical protein
MRAGALLLVAVALAGAAGAERGAAAERPEAEAARVLLARLRASGRAEVDVRLTRRDPLGGRASTVRGRLVLELPRFAGLTLAGGERLTLRADGGDWLQPAQRQLVRAGPRAAAGALVWWGLLLDPAGGGIRAERSGPRAYRLVPAGTPDAPAQILELGGDGLPRRFLLVSGPGEGIEYRLTGWRFTRARGRADFVLDAPAGYEVVDMP